MAAVHSSDIIGLHHLQPPPTHPICYKTKLYWDQNSPTLEYICSVALAKIMQSGMSFFLCQIQRNSGKKQIPKTCCFDRSTFLLYGNIKTIHAVVANVPQMQFRRCISQYPGEGIIQARPDVLVWI